MHPTRIAAPLCIALTVAATVAGCTIERSAAPTTSTTTVTVTRGNSPAEQPAEPAAPETEPAGLEQLLAAIAPTLQGTTQVVLFDGRTVLSTDTTQQGPAWSTIKVPLGMAAVAANSQVADSAALRQAITLSDNDAAMQLWEGLGGGEAAAQATSALVGVPVPASRPRPEFSPYGQTQWPLEDQARFAWNLPCTSGVVYDLMGQIDPSQNWGLGQIAGVHFKGGWGPDVDGTYFVRQFGTIPTATGVLGIAIATRAPDGTFASGTAQLTRVASVLTQALATMNVEAASQCSDDN